MEVGKNVRHLLVEIRRSFAGLLGKLGDENVEVGLTILDLELQLAVARSWRLRETRQTKSEEGQWGKCLREKGGERKTRDL
jgi:hypothetical protein